MTTLLRRLRERFLGSGRSMAQTLPVRLTLDRLDDRITPSTIYGLTTNNILIRFDSANPGTIQATAGITGLQTASERVLGLDFRPRTGQLIATTAPVGSVNSATLRTYTIDPLTGAATFIGTVPGTLVGAGDRDTGLDFNPTVDRIRFIQESNENGRINPNNGSLAGGA